MLTCSCHNKGPARACLERHDSRTNRIRLAVSSFELTQRGHPLSPRRRARSVDRTTRTHRVTARLAGMMASDMVCHHAPIAPIFQWRAASSNLGQCRAIESALHGARSRGRGGVSEAVGRMLSVGRPQPKHTSHTSRPHPPCDQGSWASFRIKGSYRRGPALPGHSAGAARSGWPLRGASARQMGPARR